MNKPTDAELEQLAKECGIGWVAEIEDVDEVLRRFARAVLARWGQPAHSGEPILYDPKALLEVFQNAQAGSSGTAGTLRGIAAVIASWESRTEPHTWLIAAPQPVEPDAIGCRCSVCNEWQKYTRSGMVCKNGHGGAPGVNYKLYTAPQVEREPLTPEAYVFELLRGVDSLDALAVWRAAEAAHGIKGGQP